MPESGTVLAVAEDVLDGGAVPVPVLHGGGLVRRGHVQVRQDEAVAVDGFSAAIALIEHVWAVPLRAAIAKAGGVAVSDE
jgi:hypothetical protein